MDRTEFEHIAINIRRRVFDTAKSYHADSAEANDIAQDVMLRF